MPSKSKAQQRFMGLVHAFNKGDVKGSEVSKKVKDVAKGMKKSDVKKYASTKHKGKPEKVKKEAIDKIREMIRMELEGCGYVMSAKNPSYKLKSPGGTGEEDKKIKESILSEGEKEKIEQLLIKYGNTPEDAKQMIRKTYDYIKKAYRNANASKKAEIMSGLMKFETTEQFSNLVEKCWKGYMIHPKRKTKKLFGKTYPNCIKKEDTLYIEAMSAAQAKAAHKKFKQTGELPPHLKKLVKDLDKVKVKYKVKNIVVPGLEWMADIKDEGFASDAQRRAAFASGYKAKGKKKKKESVSEAMDKRQGAETLKQLGGNRFIAMTGAKHFGVGPNGMSFKIGRNSKRVNHVTIDYDRGRDLYNMKFDWVTIKGIKNKKTLKGIYADQLQDMFTKYTGMYTSL